MGFVPARQGKLRVRGGCFALTLPPRPQVPPGRSGRVLPWCRRSSSASCCSTSSFMSATHSACVFSDLELVLWLLLSLAWQYGRAILAASIKQSNLAGRSAYGGRLAVAEGTLGQLHLANSRSFGCFLIGFGWARGHESFGATTSPSRTRAGALRRKWSWPLTWPAIPA